jgi:hypothetical protein
MEDASGEFEGRMHDSESNDLLFTCIERDQVDKITKSEIPPDSLLITDVDLSDPAAKGQLPRMSAIAEGLTGSIRGRLA